MNHAQHIRWAVSIVFVGCATLMGSCIDLTLPEDVTLFDVGSSFVVRGTAALVDTPEGPCRVWVGENGISYHLFQSVQLENETFDQVSREGATSRLVLARRSDIELACSFGTIVEVRDVLEIDE